MDAQVRFIFPQSEGMDLKTFIGQFDYKGSIVLLEGKREVAKEDETKLIQLGELLAGRTHYMRFRSGNAAGSDEFFSKGVAAIDPNRLEVITPYAGHRRKTNVAGTIYNLDEMNLAEEPDMIYETRQNKSSKLVDRYVDGDRGRLGMKAAYLLRDTAKVTGAKGIPPATAGIFYDDLSKPKTGGTGHTMEVCDRKGVPVIDQRVWMGWLGDLSSKSNSRIDW